MKITPLLAVACLGASSAAHASLLVGFHDFDSDSNVEAHDFAVSGFSGTVTDGLSSEDVGGSNDNLYGPTSIPVLPGSPTLSATQDGHVKVQEGSGSLVFAITNGTLGSVSLATFVFDAAYKESATSDLVLNWSVSGGGASGSTTFNPSHQQTVWDGPGNYDDLALDLVGVTLASTQTISFTFSTLAGGGETFRLDNIALTAIPETTGVMALAGLMVSGAFFRRRPVAQAAATA